MSDRFIGVDYFNDFVANVTVHSLRICLSFSLKFCLIINAEIKTKYTSNHESHFQRSAKLTRLKFRPVISLIKINY